MHGSNEPNDTIVLQVEIINDLSIHHQCATCHLGPSLHVQRSILLPNQSPNGRGCIERFDQFTEKLHGLLERLSEQRLAS